MAVHDLPLPRREGVVRAAGVRRELSASPAAHVAALQRAAGNAAVASLLGQGGQRMLQRAPGWQGADVADDRNKGTTTVDPDRPGGKKTRRIPVEGVRSGYAAGKKQPKEEQDAVNERGSYESVETQTQEQAGGEQAGRAIVAIPEGLGALDSVDVLFHLHGYAVGWRARIPRPAARPRRERGKPPPPTPPPTPLEPADISLDRIEQQLEASGRPMIAILPQGSTRSFFGDDTAAVNVKTYIDEVFALLTDADWPSGKKPKHVGGIVLSGHSGAGHALGKMLESTKPPPRRGRADERLVPGTDRPVELEDPSKRSVTDTAYLQGLVVFDTINPAGTTTATQYTQLRDFLERQLAHDLKELHTRWRGAQESQTPDDKTARDQERWLAESGFRFRGFATAGGYGRSFEGLDKEIDRWFRTHASELGGAKSCVFHALRDNYKVRPAGVDHMHMLGGGVTASGTREHENLRAALDALPKPAAQRTGCDPIPAKPLPKPEAAAPARRRRAPAAR